MLTVTTGTVGPVLAQPGASNGEWRSYAADTWGSKYSPLDQLTAANFGELTVAWRWRTADTHLVLTNESGSSLVPAQTLFDRLEEAEPVSMGTAPAAGATGSARQFESLARVITVGAARRRRHNHHRLVY